MRKVVKQTVMIYPEAGWKFFLVLTEENGKYTVWDEDTAASHLRGKTKFVSLKEAVKFYETLVSEHKSIGFKFA